MPIGSPADETGVLLLDAGCLKLRRDDGGTWRLDADLDAVAFLGARVRVTGFRSGFDLLDVTSIRLC